MMQRPNPLTGPAIETRGIDRLRAGLTQLLAPKESQDPERQRLIQAAPRT